MTDEECDKQIAKLKILYFKGKITIDEYIERINSIQYGVDLFYNEEKENDNK